MKLTVIVPTLNEAEHLPAALSSLPSQAEVIVADGGSIDETVAIATRAGATVLRGSKGRAHQMNCGAKAAHGDTLLFLHADCTLGRDAHDQIQAALADDDVVGGSFRMSIEGAGWGLRCVAAGSNIRARYLGAPYGDQAIFVRRSTVDEIGGFPEIPFMEDVALVRKLRRRGRLVVADETVTTGARHWQHLGPVATTLLNWATVSLFLLGIPAERLAPLYQRLRRGGAGSTTAKVLSSS